MNNYRTKSTALTTAIVVVELLLGLTWIALGAILILEALR
jgi:hypothetical protein